eukprot:6206016-Pleurochrysis_carterae.AAC.1
MTVASTCSTSRFLHRSALRSAGSAHLTDGEGDGVGVASAAVLAAVAALADVAGVGTVGTDGSVPSRVLLRA